MRYIASKEREFKFLIGYNSNDSESLRCMAYHKQKLMLALTNNRKLPKHEVFISRSPNYWELRLGGNLIALHWFDVSSRNMSNFIKKYRTVFRIYICDISTNKSVYDMIKWKKEILIDDEDTTSDMTRFCVANDDLGVRLFEDFQIISNGHEMYEVYINRNKDCQLDVRKIPFSAVKHLDDNRIFTSEEMAKIYLIQESLREINFYKGILEKLKKRHKELIS